MKIAVESDLLTLKSETREEPGSYRCPIHMRADGRRRNAICIGWATSYVRFRRSVDGTSHILAARQLLRFSLLLQEACDLELTDLSLASLLGLLDSSLFRYSNAIDD